MNQRRRFRPTTVSALAAMIACGSLAATLPKRRALGFIEQDRFRKVPIVMVVFDEFPLATLMNAKGKIDGNLFPNFARIQRDSVWFRNATTVSSFTAKAMPSLLTGRYPQHLTDPAARRSSIFNLLGGAYNIRAKEEKFSELCPSNACEDSATPATERLAQRYKRIFPGARGDIFLRFLGYLRDVDKPRFYFMHLAMPHSPWRYLPTGQAYPQIRPIPGEYDSPGKGKEWLKDQWLVTQAYQRHLLQTALLDRQVGVLINKLKQKDIYGRSLFIVTADHGIAYGPGASKRVIVKKTIGHISAVPLFVKLPRQKRGRISDRPLQTIDLVPTIADILNLSSSPQGIDGISGFRNRFPRHRRRTTEGLEIGFRGLAKYEVAKMKYGMFNKKNRTLDLFLLGPGGTRLFVGRPVDDMNLAPPGTTTVSVNDLETHENADPNAPLLPALLEGRLNGVEPDAGEKVAIAMNGRVVAVTRTYSKDGLAHFYAMLPPRWFGTPPNEVEFYLVEDTASETLVPLPHVDSPAEYISD